MILILTGSCRLIHMYQKVKGYRPGTGMLTRIIILFATRIRQDILPVGMESMILDVSNMSREEPVFNPPKEIIQVAI